MNTLIAGTAIFFVLHFYSSFRSRSPGKDIKERLGEGPYMGLYSVMSLVGLGLMIYGYIQAPPAAKLYIGPEWAREAAAVLMLPAFILLIAAYVPGTHIKGIVKHPMLSAIILWSIAHLLPGADLKELILFGSFLSFGVIDFITVSMRENTVEPEARSVSKDLVAIVIGGGVYAATLLWGHAAIFGVQPLV